MEETTTAISAVKREVKLRDWAAQIEAQQASGMTVQQWCAENRINPKTYYYHLRKIREKCVASAPAIVPLTIPKHTADIHIEKTGLQISLPANISAETLIALVHELSLSFACVNLLPISLHPHSLQFRYTLQTKAPTFKRLHFQMIDINHLHSAVCGKLCNEIHLSFSAILR